MYYIDQRYRGFKKDESFDDLDKAIAAAELMASKDYEEYTFFVVEVKSATKSEPPAFPIKTVDTSDITVYLEKLNEKKDD